MRKGRKESANYKGACQCPTHSGFAVVLKILGHGKAEAHQRCVYYSINNAVKFVLLPEEENKQDQSLGTLLHDWSKDDSAGRTARLLALSQRSDDQSAHRIEYEGNKHGHEGAPEERRAEHPHRLRFIAIDPEHQCHIDWYGYRRTNYSDQQRNGSRLKADQQ